MQTSEFQSNFLMSFFYYSTEYHCITVPLVAYISWSKGEFESSALKTFQSVSLIKLNAPLHFKTVVLKAAFPWTSRREMMECWCGEGAGVFLWIGWVSRGKTIPWIEQLNLPGRAEAVSCARFVFLAHAGWRGCKSGAVVWNAARVRTCFLFQLCKTPLKSTACWQQLRAQPSHFSSVSHYADGDGGSY